MMMSVDCVWVVVNGNKISLKELEKLYVDLKSGTVSIKKDGFTENYDLNEVDLMCSCVEKS